MAEKYRNQNNANMIMRSWIFFKQILALLNFMHNVLFQGGIDTQIQKSNSIEYSVWVAWVRITSETEFYEGNQVIYMVSIYIYLK